MKHFRSTMKRCLLLSVLLLMMLPGRQAMAASQKSKAMKAYSKYLAKHLPDPSYERWFYDASFNPSNKDYASSFFLYDINKDKVPELFTYTIVNFRWFNVRIFTYKSGKVKPYKIKGAGKAEFIDRATAIGIYSFFICSKRHIHNMWSGSTPIGEGSYEKVYVSASGQLKEYLAKDDKFTGRSSSYKKNGKAISAAAYASLTQKCSARPMKAYDNTAANRRKLSRGGIKVN